MLTEVRIRGRKLFHHDVWRVLINGRKCLYDANNDCFMEVYGMGDYGKTVAKKDMPLNVHFGFSLAWDANRLLLYMRYSQRRSYGWKLLIGTLQAEGRDIIVFSRRRRMGALQLVDDADNPLKKIPTLPVVV